MDLLWIIAVLVGGYVFVIVIVRNFNNWYYGFKEGNKGNPLPPGDMGWPLIGNMPTFLKTYIRGDPNSFITNLASRYGKTGIYKSHLFWSPAIIVSAPETCKQLLADDEHFVLGYPETSKTLGGRRSLHSITRAEHKRVRRLVTPVLSGHEALSSYIVHVENNAINSLEEWVSMNRPIDILAELRTVVFKFITHTFIGANDNDAIVREMEILFTDLHAGLISLNINLPGFAFHRALQSRKRLVKILQVVLDKKRAEDNVKGKTGGKDMMDSLMALEDEDGRKLGDEDIIDLLILFLLAGHESSVLGTLWGMIFLSDHPHVFQKAKAEQEIIIKNRPADQKGLSFKEIKQMGYLAKVIDEMLRHTNMVFANFREATADVNINGYFIPKGWKVFAWSRGVHMDPEIYSNPLEFNPERWDNVRPRPGASIPFGLGSRYCPGSDLAKLEISIFLHYFLLNYRLERVNPKCTVTYLTVPRPTDNCLAKVIKVA